MLPGRANPRQSWARIRSLRPRCQRDFSRAACRGGGPGVRRFRRFRCGRGGRRWRPSCACWPRRRPRHCCCIRRRRWRRAQSQRCCPDAGNDGPGAASRSRESRPWAWNGSGHLTPSACAAHWMQRRMQRRIPGPPSPKPQKPQKPPTSRRHRPRSRRPAGRRLQLRRQTPQRRRTAPTSTHCTHCCCSVSAHWLGLSPHQPAAPSSSGWSAPAPPPWNSRTT